MHTFDLEAKQRFGETEAYKEYAQKTAEDSQAKRQEIQEGLMAIFAEFAACMQSGQAADSAVAQALVKELQTYITKNYYTCTPQILAGLGQMYVADRRFKNNIDKYAVGTAEFTSKAIEIFCK